jgi:hypothetical protein
MRYDVTYRRMSEDTASHLLHFCPDIETAIELTRRQYPGCLIIKVVATE